MARTATRDRIIEREYQEFVEAFAVLHRQLFALEADYAAGDLMAEDRYNTLYASAMIPMITRCKQSAAGSYNDLFVAIMRDSAALARI